MEPRTVWVVNFRTRSGSTRKAEYLCSTTRQAEQLFFKDNPPYLGYEIISILDWRDDLKNERRKSK